MTALYEILGVPFGFLLRLIYDTVGFQNYAISIVLLTLVTRLITIPSTISQQKGMAKTQRIQSKIRRIQTKYAGNQQKIQEETSALYQREGYNPMNAGCTPMLFQFILLFGLIGAIYYPLSNFLTGITEAEIKLLSDAVAKISSSKFASSSHLAELLIIQNIDQLQGIPGVSQATYDAIANVNFDFFGLFSLGDVPKGHGLHVIWAIPVLSFLSSLATGIYSHIKQKKSNPAMANNPTMGCMMFGMPLFSLYFVVNYPAGIGIYWIASSIFSFIITVVVGHFYSPKKTLAKIMVDETVARRSKENNTKLIAANKK
ncbi:MAG: YidC/Oxa1 family membrane protein insertase [Clostridia bacterium]|nr:YidC/Oxa1 family membrane protein insertase [Clostridia bacterium]MBQ2694645.1 YidC/Oxa1 family membrane protein insertase [Clostridia bacterium]